jgi:EAL domain-containing protein (putative c-di-GMP-specific phosphodiesterase class I)
MEALRELEVDYVQGYYIGRPSPLNPDRRMKRWADD